MNSKGEDKLITEGSCLLETQMLEMNGRVSKSKTRTDADLTKCQEAFSLSLMGTQTSEILEKTSIKEKDTRHFMSCQTAGLLWMESPLAHFLSSQHQKQQ